MSNEVNVPEEAFADGLAALHELLAGNFVEDWPSHERAVEVIVNAAAGPIRSQEWQRVLDELRERGSISAALEEMVRQSERQRVRESVLSEDVRRQIADIAADNDDAEDIARLVRKLLAALNTLEDPEQPALSEGVGSGAGASQKDGAQAFGATGEVFTPSAAPSVQADIDRELEALRLPPPPQAVQGERCGTCDGSREISVPDDRFCSCIYTAHCGSGVSGRCRRRKFGSLEEAPGTVAAAPFVRKPCPNCQPEKGGER